MYGDVDVVAHDGTVHMGLGGAPVALNGAVILDLLVLRFSLFPAQGGRIAHSPQEGQNQVAIGVALRDLHVFIAFGIPSLADGRMPWCTRATGGRSP